MSTFLQYKNAKIAETPETSESQVAESSPPEEDNLHAGADCSVTSKLKKVHISNK